MSNKTVSTVIRTFNPDATFAALNQGREMSDKTRNEWLRAPQEKKGKKGNITLSIKLN